jgi:hypothetical protein
MLRTNPHWSSAMKLTQILLALLLFPFLNSHAEVLNKCVSSSSAGSWQSAACGQGMRQMRSVTYTPETSTVATATVHRPAEAAHRARSSRRYGYRVPSYAVRATRNPCVQAKDHRESTLVRVGLKRTYDLLSKLDADVRLACR